MEKKPLPIGVVIGVIAVAVALLGFVVYKAMSGPIGGVDPEIAKLQGEAEAARLPNGGQPGTTDPNAAPNPAEQGTTGFSPGREGVR